MKRIAFCGASGTGKTTLAMYLAEALSLPFNPIGSRSVAWEMGFLSPYDVDEADETTYLEQLRHEPPDRAANLAMQCAETSPPVRTCRRLFQGRLLGAKMAWENAHVESGFVTDRTVVDNLAYTTLHDYAAVSEEAIEAVRSHVHNYEVIFLTPLEAFYKHDGDVDRVGSTVYHRLYETLLLGMLRYYLGDLLFSSRVVVLGMSPIGFRKSFVRNTCEGIPSDIPNPGIGQVNDLNVFSEVSDLEGSLSNLSKRMYRLPKSPEVEQAVVQTRQAAFWLHALLKRFR